MSNTINKDLLKELPRQAMFGHRNTIEEAYKYAEGIASASDSPIHTITAVLVLYNTIVENFYLVSKDKVEL